MGNLKEAFLRAMAKVRLAHRPGATVVIPEVVVIVLDDRLGWVQTQFFYAPLLGFGDGLATATLPFAALDPTRRNEEGLECEIRFQDQDLLTTTSDGAQIYNAELTSNHAADELVLGDARQRDDGALEVLVHHHTTPDALIAITRSGHVRGSGWNYQGTRQLENVAYAYFTGLSRIEHEADLHLIAMASDGCIGLRLDTTVVPVPDLVLPVYRESTINRRSTLSLWVPGDLISAPHIYIHPGGRLVYYEVAHPWIHRVGLARGEVLTFDDGDVESRQDGLRRFDYVVIGDCTTLEGLEAPYDEENTDETFALVDLDGTDVFQYWRDHANQPLYRPPAEPQRGGPRLDPN